jgi:hypothetical protein
LFLPVIFYCPGSSVCNTDQRTLGGLFAQLADEINNLDWAVALNSLLELLSDISNTAGNKIKKIH